MFWCSDTSATTDLREVEEFGPSTPIQGEKVVDVESNNYPRYNWVYTPTYTISGQNHMLDSTNRSILDG